MPFNWKIDLEGDIDEDAQTNFPPKVSSATASPTSNGDSEDSSVPDDIDHSEPASSAFDEVVSVRVANTKTFKVNKTLLVTIPFFERCLNSAMKESSNNIVELPKDDPKTFDIVLKFLYSADSALDEFTVEDIVAEDGIGGTALWVTVRKVYTLADKLSYEELLNKISDIHRGCTRYFSIAGPAISELIRKMPDDDALIRMWLTKMAWHVKCYGYEQDHEVYDKETVFQWAFESDPILGRKFFGVLTSMEQLDHPFYGDRCRWHLHHSTTACINATTIATIAQVSSSVGIGPEVGQHSESGTWRHRHKVASDQMLDDY